MVAQTQISLPTELVEQLNRDAEAMKVSLPAYVAFLRECNSRQLDSKFREAAKHVFSKYPETLRKLAMIGASIGRPRFLTLDEILVLHQTATIAHGGSHGVRDQGLLASALAQPQQGFAGNFAHQFPFEMAAAYGFHIAKNHAFIDGNKRTAWTACAVFLRMNGWNVTASEDDATTAMLSLSSDLTWTKARFAQWLQEHSQVRPSLELRDFFAELDIARVHELLEAAVAAKSHKELNASAIEASLHIPLVKSLFDASRFFYEHGQPESGEEYMGNQAMLLVSLYRIAEDMGYDW